MNTFVALLRGVNVGGKHIVPMQELRLLLNSKSYTDIKTYIQSGNIIFRSSVNNKSSINKKISSIIAKKYNFTAEVLTLTLADIQEAIDNNPFSVNPTEYKNLYLYFLLGEAKGGSAEKLEELKAKTEQLYLSNRVLYMYAKEGIGRSKLAAKIDKILGVSTTARNMKTVTKLQEIAATLC